MNSFSSQIIDEIITKQRLLSRLVGIVFILSIALNSCTGYSPVVRIQQNLENGDLLGIGMDKRTVESIMGEAIDIRLVAAVEEWDYCFTGPYNEHVVLFFAEGSLISKHSYNVGLVDTSGVPGECNEFLKQGSYQEPLVVKMIRGAQTESLKLKY